MSEGRHAGVNQVESPLLAPPGIAWQKAESLGFDMSLVEDRLRLSVAERFETHERVRAAVIALRQAGIDYYGFDPRHSA